MKKEDLIKEGSKSDNTKELEFHRWRHDWQRNIINIVNIRPHSIGSKFSNTEMAQLEDWLKSHGFEIGRDSKNTVIRVILPMGSNQVEADKFFRDNGIAKLHEQEKQAKEAERQKEADLKDSATKKRASYNWIIGNFGEGTMNNYNINALSDFLEGKEPKFKGMINSKWLEPATKLNVVDGNRVDFAKLKTIYESNSAISRSCS